MSPKDRVSAFTAQLAKGVAQSHHIRISFLYRRLILRKEDSFFQNYPLVLEIFSIFHRNPMCKQFVCLERSAVEPAHREFQILGFHKPCIWAVLGTFLRKSLKRTFNSQVTRKGLTKVLTRGLTSLATLPSPPQSWTAWRKPIPSLVYFAAIFGVFYLTA